MRMKADEKWGVHGTVDGGISGMPQSDKDALMEWDTSEELGEVNYSCEDDNAACDV